MYSEISKIQLCIWSCVKCAGIIIIINILGWHIMLVCWVKCDVKIDRYSLVEESGYMVIFEWFNLRKQMPAKHFEKIFTKMEESIL